MIFGQLPGKSPEKRTRSVIKTLSGTAVYHMTCLQANRVRMVYDDTYYQNCPVNRVMLIVQIMQYEKGQSPRGMATINLKVKDSTGRCTVAFYHSEQLEQLCKSDEYMKIGVKIKCAGEVFRPTIKIMGTSLVQLQDHNELTEHLLECMQTQLKTE